MAHFAKKLGANAIAHGATGKGNDQLRFEKSWAYLVPEVKVIAPWKEWSYTGRQDLLKYLSYKGFDLQSAEKLYSVDTNLFHRSCEGGILENPGKEYQPEQIYEWVKAPSQISKDAITVSVQFPKWSACFPERQENGPGRPFDEFESGSRTSWNWSCGSRRRTNESTQEPWSVRDSGRNSSSHRCSRVEASLLNWTGLCRLQLALWGNIMESSFTTVSGIRIPSCGGNLF